MSPAPIKILLVEDSPDHAELTIRALRDGNMLNEIFQVKDGEEAPDFLYRHDRCSNGAGAPRPGLVLLDINENHRLQRTRHSRPWS